MVKKIIELKISNISRFIEIVQNSDSNKNYLFRGQNSDWDLRPKLGRIIEENKVRFDLSITELEEKLINTFKRNIKPFVSQIPDNRFQLLALAQHHGLPTRLLDWTSNPLVALWFCIEKPCCKDYGVVWMLKIEEEYLVKPTTKFEDLEAIDKTLLFQPEIVTPRIIAQNAWFSVHALNNQKNNFTRFNMIGRYRELLIKIMVPSESFKNLRICLDKFGINQSTVYPDLDGMTSYVNWCFSKLDDEK